MVITYKEGTKFHVVPNVHEIRTSGTYLSIVVDGGNEPKIISRNAEFIIKEDASDNPGTLCMGSRE